MIVIATQKSYMLYPTRISMNSSFRLEHLVHAMYVHDLTCCYSIETNSIRNLINHFNIQGATNPKQPSSIF
uniref:Uncharacterized protein n=1 Tax=Lepeophtheirus salmonis TaxID=72036 RepID=A0A0K2TF09_LEPSM